MVACLVVLLEAAALLGMAVAFGVDVVRGRAIDVGSTVAMAVFFAGVALLLGGAARALWRGRRWGRGPVLTWQLLQALSALALAPATPAALVVAMVAAAAVVIAGVLWPSSREHADQRGTPSALA